MRAARLNLLEVRRKFLQKLVKMVVTRGVSLLGALSSLGLLLAVAGVHSSLGNFGPRKNVRISRQLQEELSSAVTMNFTETPTQISALAHHPPAGALPSEFELFDPPNLYVYHDYVSQGLPKFMTGVELSTGTQRVIFIVHWSVRYFLVILLVLGMLQ